MSVSARIREMREHQALVLAASRGKLAPLLEKAAEKFKVQTPPGSKFKSEGVGARRGRHSEGGDELDVHVSAAVVGGGVLGGRRSFNAQEEMTVFGADRAHGGMATRDYADRAHSVMEPGKRTGELFVVSAMELNGEARPRRYSRSQMTSRGVAFDSSFDELHAAQHRLAGVPGIGKQDNTATVADLRDQGRSLAVYTSGGRRESIGEALTRAQRGGRIESERATFARHLQLGLIDGRQYRELVAKSEAWDRINGGGA